MIFRYRLAKMLARRRWARQQRLDEWNRYRFKAAAQTMVTGVLRGWWPGNTPVDLYNCQLDGRAVGDWRITVERINKV